jgi:hypothetical protein
VAPFGPIGGDVVRPIADLPGDVIGFEGVGEIEASDHVDVLMPAVRVLWSVGGCPGRLVVRTVRWHVGWMTPGELKRFPPAERDAIACAARDTD